MPRAEQKKQNLCISGVSFNRRKEAHEKGTPVLCYRCSAVMGCRWCCEPPRELICLHCHNWASRRGVERHGDVVPNDKVQHVHTDRGWRHWREGENPRGEVVRLIERSLDR